MWRENLDPAAGVDETIVPAVQVATPPPAARQLSDGGSESQWSIVALLPGRRMPVLVHANLAAEAEFPCQSCGSRWSDENMLTRAGPSLTVRAR